MKQIAKTTENSELSIEETAGSDEQEHTEAQETEVILKGEIHTSESDLAEERDLLTEGCDVLVLEGQQEDAEYGLLRSWYATAMGIAGLVLFRTLYTDHRILVDLADAQDADVMATRTSDAELVENANPLVEFVAGLLFYGIFSTSVFYGLITGETISGAILLLGSALLPILLLRYHGMTRRSGKLNRDSIIAKKITEASERSNRVVAVVGADHLHGVESQLPDHIELETKDPAYGLFSIRHAKEIARPAFTAFSVLFVLYLVILEIFRWMMFLI
jgi:hypothetical protein